LSGNTRSSILWGILPMSDTWTFEDDNPHNVADMQITKLARFIVDEVPGEPSQSEGAVDCAIRIIRSLRRWKAEAMEVLTAWEDVWETAGRPGRLGHSKAKGVRDYIRTMRTTKESSMTNHNVFDDESEATDTDPTPAHGIPRMEYDMIGPYNMGADYSSLHEPEIRHRFGYHQPVGNAGQVHQALRKMMIDVAQILDRMLPEGRAKSVAMTHLEEACMWGNKAIAELSPVVDE
jgi:hypothetical protein